MQVKTSKRKKWRTKAGREGKQEKEWVAKGWRTVRTEGGNEGREKSK